MAARQRDADQTKAAEPAWPPFRRAWAIDAAGFPDVLGVAPDDPGYADGLQAVRDCGLTAIIVTVMAFGASPYRYDDTRFEAAKKALADWRTSIDRHADLLVFVSNPDDLERARRERKIGVIATFQGTELIGEDLDRIAAYRALGVRVMQLTHNLRNLVGDGSLEPGNAGLSNFGRALVERLNAERIVVDLAHGAQRTTREGILASRRPVIISHSGCRALSDTPRLVPDAELKLMADRGGVVGIIFWPYLREQGQQTADDVIRHIDHAIDVCGEDHVGIGTDLAVAPTKITPTFREENAEGIRHAIKLGVFAPDRNTDTTLFPPDLNTARRFDVLAAKLAARGHPDARIEKILGGNFARVLRDVWG